MLEKLEFLEKEDRAVLVIWLKGDSSKSTELFIILSIGILWNSSLGSRTRRRLYFRLG